MPTSSVLQCRRAIRMMTTAGGLLAVSVSVAVPAADRSASPDPRGADVPALLTPIEVTGSRLKHGPIDGPLPVTAISREQIEQSGEISVAAFLRGMTVNSFGSFTPTSGTGSGQGGAQISLRGLGAGRTLVLIDGRRMPNDPGGFGGATQNINLIPLALIDRIEILRDGASAIYGADAIGGVVNIITRENYSGMQLSGQIDSPSERGGDARGTSLSGGMSGADGALYFLLEQFSKDIIFSRDRDVVSEVSSARGYPGTIYEYDAGGHVVAQPSNPDANGNSRNFRPFDNCPSGGFGSDQRYPESAVVDGVCRYQTGAVTALTADLQRQSLTFGGRYYLTQEISGFARATMVSAESFGRFPAATVNRIVEGIHAPDANGNQGIRIASDNPNNPNPGSTLVLNYSTTVLGARDNTVGDQVNQFVLGASGRFDESAFTVWELAANFDDYQQHDVGLNYALSRELQAAVDAARFNPFAPDPAAADEFRYTTTRDNRFRSSGVDGRLDAQLELGGLSINTVFGLEYRDDDFAVVSDAQSSQAVFFDNDGAISGFRASNVLGSKGGSARGKRSYQAVFFESGSTFFDQRVEMALALRYDGYSDVGGQLSPKLSARYRLFDSLSLRGSLGRGFRAPDLGAMYGSPGDSVALVIDRVGCRDNPGDPSACSTDGRTAVLDSNPQLGAERSDQRTVGVIWSPGEQLTFALDYYAIEIGDAVTRLTPQAVFDNELTCDTQGRRCDARSEGYVVRSEGNNLLFAYVPSINAAQLETDGIDVDLSYRYASDRYGRYTLTANLSRVLSYKRQDVPGGALVERLDTLNSGFEIFPDLRAGAALSWTLGRYSSALRLNYIGEVSDCDAPDKLRGSAACANDFGDYRTVDLQFGIDTPWKQKLAVGARNLFDERPAVSGYVRSAAVPGIFYSLHDADQRVFYVRVTQDF